MIKGYVVYDVTCKKVLNRYFDWVSLHDAYRGGFIFTGGELETIRKMGAERWDIQPVYVRRATWSEDDGADITGRLEPFWEVEEA